MNKIDKIYHELEDLENEYPDFHNWYYQKVVPSLQFDERKIFIYIESSNIAAIMILKDGKEKKISTLRVKDEYRNQGLATELIKLSFKELGTKKPLITVSENHIFEYLKLFESCGFSKYAAYDDYYVKGKKEYSFNAPIEDIGEECVGF